MFVIIIVIIFIKHVPKQDIATYSRCTRGMKVVWQRRWCQASKQANELTNQQTNKPITNRQTNKQSNKESNQQSNNCWSLWSCTFLFSFINLQKHMLPFWSHDCACCLPSSNWTMRQKRDGTPQKQSESWSLCLSHNCNACISETHWNIVGVESPI